VRKHSIVVETPDGEIIRVEGDCLERVEALAAEVRRAVEAARQPKEHTL
jgi:hypothetical protein